ncbi:MAG: hypothetical protein HRT72_12110 [Flavobacteriales bacterium]|nr:hypothetical protein [Flavobacteriales bacterium]
MFSTVSFCVEDNNYESNVILTYALFIIGVRSKPVEVSTLAASENGIYYGNTKPKDFNGIYISKKSAEIDEVRNLINTSTTPSNHIEFDIIDLLNNLLSDKINTEDPSATYDYLDRQEFESTFQAKNKLADKPIVNFLIKHLKKCLDNTFDLNKMPLWPQDKKCSIILSHDVDEPIKHAPLFNYRLFPKSIKEIPRHYYHLLRLIVKYTLDKNINDFWLFDEIINLEKSYGFKSSFYFAVVNNRDEYAHEFDVDYKIHDKAFKPVFEKIKKSGFEIGLHASFNAHLDDSRFQTEKNTLEKASGVKPIGLRHHYWNLGKDYRKTLEAHNNAGFLYDTSIGFNFDIGYRNNSALPYPLIYSADKKTLNMIQIPPFCMDGNIFYKNLDVESGFKDIMKAISTIKNCEGVGAIDWHVRTAIPKNKAFNNWGKLYIKILEELSKDNEIWVTSGEEIYSWMKSRKEQLDHSENKYFDWLN